MDNPVIPMTHPLAGEDCSDKVKIVFGEETLGLTEFGTRLCDEYAGEIQIGESKRTLIDCLRTIEEFLSRILNDGSFDVSYQLIGSKILDRILSGDCFYHGVKFLIGEEVIALMQLKRYLLQDMFPRTIIINGETWVFRSILNSIQNRLHEFENAYEYLYKDQEIVDLRKKREELKRRLIGTGETEERLSRISDGRQIDVLDEAIRNQRIAANNSDNDRLEETENQERREDLRSKLFEDESNKIEEEKCRLTQELSSVISAREGVTIDYNKCYDILFNQIKIVIDGDAVPFHRRGESITLLELYDKYDFELSKICGFIASTIHIVLYFSSEWPRLALNDNSYQIDPPDSYTFENVLRNMLGARAWGDGIKLMIGDTIINIKDLGRYLLRNSTVSIHGVKICSYYLMRQIRECLCLEKSRLVIPNSGGDFGGWRWELCNKE